MVDTDFNLPLLGDNSVQTLEINLEDVKQIKLTLRRSGAVSSISYCYPVEGTAPRATPTRPPTPLLPDHRRHPTGVAN